MRFATFPDGTPDGRLHLISSDQRRALDAGRIAPNLLTALQNWGDIDSDLRRLSAELEAGEATGARPFDPLACAAPLPRSPQWCDASAFLNHGRLMEQAFGTPPIHDFDSVPVIYQGASDDHLGPGVDVPFVDEADGIDFEGEFGVVVGDVPMGASPNEALDCVRLLVQINDWSLRKLGAYEMPRGFGFLQAKPSTSFAPMAVTLDELGDTWRDGRIHLRLHIELNGVPFGQPFGGEMNFGFGELIAHVARTRRIRAGSIIGSGTVSNVDRAAGSACIAERRVIEMIDSGQAVSPFMHFGDRVTMRACHADGRPGPFGGIDQRVVRAVRAGR
jgi:fumarylacetoacetate (FAA) hydrolase